MRNRPICYWLGLFLFFSAGCATVPRPPALPQAQRLYLKDLCERNFIDLEWDTVTQAVTLEFFGIHARGLIGSDLIILDGRQIRLSQPLMREDQAIVVPLDFESKVIVPLLEIPETQAPLMRRIIIDAGHGGRDPGAVGCHGLQEKDVVLDITRRLVSSLRAKGFEVTLTRSGDEFISLEKRTEIATAAEVDMFVSIHANSCTSRYVDGIEVFYLRDLTWQEHREPQRKRNHEILFERLTMQKDHKQVRAIVQDLLYEKKIEASRFFADLVAKDLSRVTNAENRGAKQAAYFVLRNTLIPAILVEVGFLSNSHEEGLLRKISYRQAIAESLADSIYTFAGRYGG